MFNQIKRALCSMFILALVASMITSHSTQAKKKIPVCTVNLFNGDTFTFESKTAKIKSVSKKGLISSKLNDDGFLQLTAKKTGTTTVLAKNKKKLTKIRFVISGDKTKCLSFKLIKPFSATGNITGIMGRLFEAEITNTSKIPLTSASIGLDNASLVSYSGTPTVYCLLPGKKVKVFVDVTTGDEKMVKLNRVTPSYYKFSKYTDMSRKVDLKLDILPNGAQKDYKYSWTSDLVTKTTEKADFAIDVTGYDEFSNPVKTLYTGGDVSSVSRVEAIYSSTDGVQGVSTSATTRAVKYTFDTLKWV